MSGPVQRPLTTKTSDGATTVRPTTTLSFNAADFDISKTGSEATISIDSTGAGAALTDTQVGFGDASNLMTSSSKFRYLESIGQLILTGVADTNAEIVIERSSGSSQRIGIENDSSASPKVTVSVPPDNAKPLMLESHVTDTAVTGGSQGFIFNVSNTSDQSISMINILTTDSSAYDVVFNEDSLNDYDVRIEGAADPNLFVADGSQDAIGIGTFPASGVKLHIRDDESDTDNVVIRIQDGTVDSVGDQVAIEGYWNTAQAGVIFFQLRDTTTAASAIVMKATNDAGSLTEFIRMDGDAKAITFNEQSEDIDFRVETNGDDSTLRIVGSTDNVGISCIPDSDALLHIQDDDGSFAATIRVESTDTDADVGPVMQLRRNPGEAVQVNDDLGKIDFQGPGGDGSGTVKSYSSIITEAQGATSGSEHARVMFKGLVSGTMKEFIRYSASGIELNAFEQDIDTKISSDGIDGMITVDAGEDIVSIGGAAVTTLTQDPPFQVANQSGPASYRYIIPSTTSPMTLTNDDLQSPLIVHASGTALTINLPLDGGVKGQYFQFVSTGGDVTLVPSAVAGDTINGGTASLTRSTNNEIYDCVCIANNTWILSNPA